MHHLLDHLHDLYNDPRQLLGWELRLSRPSIRDDDADAFGSPRRRGRRKRPPEFNEAAAQDNARVATAGVVLGRSLGHVVEILTAAASYPTNADAAAAPTSDGTSGNPAAAKGPTAPPGRHAARAAVAPTRRAAKTVAAAAGAAGAFGSSGGGGSGGGGGGGPRDDEGGWGQPRPQLQPQQPQIMLRAVLRTIVQQYDFEGSEEYVVRLDPAVLPYADMASRTLVVEPPEGLLEQGRRSLLLQLLKRELGALPTREPRTDTTTTTDTTDSINTTTTTTTDTATTDTTDTIKTTLSPPADHPGAMDSASAPTSTATTSSGEALSSSFKRQRAAVSGRPSSSGGSSSGVGDGLAPGGGGGGAMLAMMPTRQQLLEAGRRDLVDMVAAAGGFSEVALQLSLRCARRPRGYWSGPDSWERLGEELAAFVAGAWVELPHPDNPNRCYYYNQISNRTTWRRPPPLQRLPTSAARHSGTTRAGGGRRADGGSAGGGDGGRGGGGSAGGGGGGSTDKGRVRWAVAEAAADRVMPSRALILQACRVDLHNAIMFHGGYLEVAASLGRRVTWSLSKYMYDSPAAVRRELAVVAKELQLPPGELPTPRDLRQSGHGALLAAVRRHEELRTLLGIQPRRRSSGSSDGRRPRGRWDDVGVLAAELRDFATATAAAAAVDDPGVCDGDGGGGGAELAVSLGDRCGGAARSQPDGSGVEEAAAGEAGDGAPALRHRGRVRTAGLEHHDQESGEAEAGEGVETPRRRRGRPQKHPQQQQQPSTAAVAPPPPLPPQAQAPPAVMPLRMPSLSQLRAAGRHDLAYAIRVTHAETPREELAAAAGLRLLRDGRGTNRNALSLEAVEEAIQAGCHTPKAIRQHLRSQRRVDVSRQHLTTYLARMAAEGRLEKLSYGRYGASGGVTGGGGGAAV
ncbi:hypothetical protein PLESTF_000238800 [Pleodorina starrii]|nr:hypothetical protein PLESTF_000238800 [Pleodorina starrii]